MEQMKIRPMLDSACHLLAVDRLFRHCCAISEWVQDQNVLGYSCMHEQQKSPAVPESLSQ